MRTEENDALGVKAAHDAADHLPDLFALDATLVAHGVSIVAAAASSGHPSFQRPKRGG